MKFLRFFSQISTSRTRTFWIKTLRAPAKFMQTTRSISIGKMIQFDSVWIPKFAVRSVLDLGERFDWPPYTLLAPRKLYSATLTHCNSNPNSLRIVLCADPAPAINQPVNQTSTLKRCSSLNYDSSSIISTMPRRRPSCSERL